jgi:hypothetical protein
LADATDGSATSTFCRTNTPLDGVSKNVMLVGTAGVCRGSDDVWMNFSVPYPKETTHGLYEPDEIKRRKTGQTR